MEHRNAAGKAFVLQIGIENRQAFGQKQALIDNRLARQAANIEIADLRGNNLLLDPAADEVEIFLKFGRIHVVWHGPCDHDLLNLGAGCLTLITDYGDIDRNLPPAIDGVACVDNFCLNNSPAIFLRAQIGTRQEHHANGQAVGHRAVTAMGNCVVKKTFGQIDMQPRAVPRLAIGVHCAPVPNRFQRINCRCNHAARRFAIGCRNQAYAARVALKFRAVHAFIGKAFMLGGGE